VNREYKDKTGKSAPKFVHFTFYCTCLFFSFLTTQSFCSGPISPIAHPRYSSERFRTNWTIIVLS